MGKNTHDRSKNIDAEPLTTATPVISQTPDSSEQTAESLLATPAVNTRFWRGGWSVSAFVLSVAGLFIGALPAVAAVIAGHIAQRKEPLSRRTWIPALVIGYAVIAGRIAVLVLVLSTITMAFSIASVIKLFA